MSKFLETLIDGGLTGLPKKQVCAKGKRMANKLTVLDLTFYSQASACDYFYNIRDEYWQSKAVISDSKVFDQLSALYERYCECTDWPITSKPVSFRVKNISRGQGSSGGTTQGFAVTFDNGKEVDFSAEKAIRAIALRKE